MPRNHWEDQASNWAAWARRPDFDAYWKYAPTFFDLVPPPGRRTLDVGCGEGRLSRDLTAHGHKVTGVDNSETLARLARDADPSQTYLRADAVALPFGDHTFDLVVFYNSLMDVEDMPGSLREAARVLTPGGALCACVTHPMADAGTFESRRGNASFIIAGSYLGGRRPVDIAVESDGMHMHFKGWAYALEDYFVALEDAGFAVQALREPRMDALTVQKVASEERWRRIPNFLMWRAVKA